LGGKREVNPDSVGDGTCQCTYLGVAAATATEGVYGGCVQKEMALKDAWLQHLMTALNSVTDTTPGGNMAQVREVVRVETTSATKILTGAGPARISIPAGGMR
jgi:hypothetical protein